MTGGWAGRERSDWRVGREGGDWRLGREGGDWRVGREGVTGGWAGRG